MTSNRPRAWVRTSTPSGNAPSVRSNPGGAARSATTASGLMPNFLGRGVLWSTPPCAGHPSASPRPSQLVATRIADSCYVASPDAVTRERGDERGEHEHADHTDDASAHHRDRRARTPTRPARPRGRRAAGRRRRRVMWIPDSRPRSASGTVAWRMVDRNTAETTSAPPATAEEHQRDRDPVPDEPESGDRHPPHDDRHHDGAALAHDAMHPAARERGHDRARRHRREQDSGQLGSGVELGPGEHREQHPRHPEHHRDEIDDERRPAAPSDRWR